MNNAADRADKLEGFLCAQRLIKGARCMSESVYLDGVLQGHLTGKPSVENKVDRIFSLIFGIFALCGRFPTRKWDQVSRYNMKCNLRQCKEECAKCAKKSAKKIIYKYVCISSICQTIYICTYVEGKQVSSYPASSTVWACNFCASFLGCILGSSAHAARYIPEILEIKMHMHLGICGVVHANAASSPLLWFGHHSCN